MDDAGRASSPAAVTVSATAAPAPPPPSATAAAADTSSPDASDLYEEGMWQQMAMSSGATMQPGPYPERPVLSEDRNMQVWPYMQISPSQGKGWNCRKSAAKRIRISTPAGNDFL
nr:unnamed protein product [Digitaria exilis]